MNVRRELTSKDIAGATRSEIEAAAAECKACLASDAVKSINLERLRSAWKIAPIARAVVEAAQVAPVARRSIAAGAVCRRCHTVCYGDCQS